MIIVVSRVLAPLGLIVGASEGARVLLIVVVVSLLAMAFWIGQYADRLPLHAAPVNSNRGAGVLMVAGLCAHYAIVEPTLPLARAIALPGVQAWGPLLLPIACLIVALGTSALVSSHRARTGDRRAEPGETMINFAASAVLVLGSWLIISSASLYAADILATLERLANGYDVTPFAVLGWVVTTLTGLLGDRLRKLGPRSRGLVEFVVNLAPHVFLYGLFFFASLLIPWPTGEDGAINWLVFGGTVASLVALLVAIAAAVDVNELSMHAFYRDQLAVAYLGEGELDPPKPVNDVTLDALADDRGPLLLVNTSCALAGDGQLAWQERRATSFVMTPLHWGYDAALVDRERDGASPSSSPLGYRALADSGIQLRTAVAISGAAASPHMGRYGSPALAGLLTVFNVRLGSWMPNPRMRPPSAPPPSFALRSLLQELTGRSGSDRDHIYLTDGGHFENLGIYELVRRRCRYIICSDANGDSTFTDLGVAIRLCRIDFGIDIDIDTSSIAHVDERGHALAHCAIGTIDYGPGQSPGILVYLCCSLTGDESRDIHSYAALNPDFPPRVARRPVLWRVAVRELPPARPAHRPLDLRARRGDDRRGRPRRPLRAAASDLVRGDGHFPVRVHAPVPAPRRDLRRAAPRSGARLLARSDLRRVGLDHDRPRPSAPEPAVALAQPRRRGLRGRADPDPAAQGLFAVLLGPASDGVRLPRPRPRPDLQAPGPRRLDERVLALGRLGHVPRDLGGLGLDLRGLAFGALASANSGCSRATCSSPCPSIARSSPSSRAAPRP